MSEELNPITRTEMFLAKAAGQNTPELTPITRVERFLQNLIDHIKSIGTGGGGATQPDWNAAEGEPGHILNRTHWEHGVEILPETEIVFDEEGWGSFSPAFEIVAGQQYRITVNGEQIIAVGTLEEDGMMTSIYGTSKTNGVFVIACMDNMALFMWMGEPIPTVLSVEKYTVNKIPDKFLPESSRSYTIEVTDEEWGTMTNGMVTMTKMFDPFVDLIYSGGTILIKVNTTRTVDGVSFVSISHAQYFSWVENESNILGVGCRVRTGDGNKDVMFLFQGATPLGD